jgi:hypothetical protein
MVADDLKIVALHLHTMTQDDPFKWFKDQARLFHRDIRLKKASRERLERTGTEAPTRKKLADINDTDDELRTEDWGRQGGITKKE